MFRRALKRPAAMICYILGAVLFLLGKFIQGSLVLGDYMVILGTLIFFTGFILGFVLKPKTAKGQTPEQDQDQVK